MSAAKAAKPVDGGKPGRYFIVTPEHAKALLGDRHNAIGACLEMLEGYGSVIVTLTDRSYTVEPAANGFGPHPVGSAGPALDWSDSKAFEGESKCAVCGVPVADVHTWEACAVGTAAREHAAKMRLADSRIDSVRLDEENKALHRLVGFANRFKIGHCEVFLVPESVPVRWSCFDGVRGTPFFTRDEAIACARETVAKAKWAST